MTPAFPSVSFLILCFLDLFLGSTSEIPCSPKPCTCEEGFINCSGLNLTTLPIFPIFNVSSNTLLIDVSDNQITTVPSMAFRNLSTANATVIRIDLRNNSISSIVVGAFTGITDVVTDLSLSTNKLTELPKAIRDLNGLKTLNVQQNDMKVFDEQTMVKLGLTLIDFSVGATANFKWSYEFRYLFQLRRLAVLYSEQDTMPPDAFVGFEKTLTSLQLEFTRLTEVPRAICELENLEKASFNYNRNLVSSIDLLPTCINPLFKVRTVLFVGNDLTYFPPILVLFPEAENLRVINNSKLNFIDDNVISSTAKLRYLDISSNAFEQFPEAVAKLGNHLSLLFLANNNIQTIEQTNFMNMSALTVLDLSKNPLSYISDAAFRSLSKVQDLNLDNTLLTTFPRAVADMTSLLSLSLNSNRILCSCDMDWILKDWKRHAEVGIYGNCGNSTLTLSDFITNYLPKCPATYTAV